jgi:hypothetical protein
VPEAVLSQGFRKILVAETPKQKSQHTRAVLLHHPIEVLEFHGRASRAQGNQSGRCAHLHSVSIDDDSAADRDTLPVFFYPGPSEAFDGWNWLAIRPD